ncbi:hypothetical protein [Helicobacter sp. 12S02634-8]|nr:hypothetical protein [Helicobacter sp. 12S02634-8]
MELIKAMGNKALEYRSSHLSASLCDSQCIDVVTESKESISDF